MTTSLMKKEPYHAQSLALSPQGHLYLYSDPENHEAIPSKLSQNLATYFAENDAIGLLRLGLMPIHSVLPASISFWQKFAQVFITEICKISSLDGKQSYPKVHPPYPQEDMKQLLDQAPFMRGGEHLDEEAASTLWRRLNQALIEELSAFGGILEAYLATYHSAWNTVGRVYFHLAENKTNSAYPFAFMATYTTGLSKSHRALHLPLGRALEEYSGEKKKSLLLALLLPVTRAVEQNSFLQKMLATGEIFQPIAWNANQAHQFLKGVPDYEAAGILVRVPNWWSAKKPPRPNIQVTLGSKPVSKMDLEALLDFDMNFVLPNGENLSSQEFNELLKSQGQLVQVKGQWIEIDKNKLKQVLRHWQTLTAQVKDEGLSFAQGVRLLSGVSNLGDPTVLAEVAEWSTVREGAWLHEVLSRLRDPKQTVDKLTKNILQTRLQADLRPYQNLGVQWLWWLYQLRLGACLADDMGLGKTIQVIALFLLIKHQKIKPTPTKPHLLVLPASLIGNWQAELKRFAPSLKIQIAHNSVSKEGDNSAQEADLIITTYATLYRLPWLQDTHWDMVILDEAQAIKNPSSKQTHAAKKLKAKVRFILTGTPIENRLGDLWSLFDFVAPGLLGSSKVFADYSKSSTAKDPKYFYAAIRRLVSPYILRRLKNDKTIINDLPDKTEMQAYCTLTKPQLGLYQHAVDELKYKLEEQTQGIKRQGLVLSYLLRFKQICNHPDQWLGHGNYQAELSGKFLRLKELCEVIAAKQEKVLVFTQFREIIAPLYQFLNQIFAEPGLFLHGQTSLKERGKRVEAFQEERGPPFFILSLKAGGTGLNLTRASHVIHFDRWWNPATENQATDRAYRIGQKSNVLVHKFVCRGTIEEKIDALILSKKSLVEELINPADEIALTSLSNSELLDMISLDIHRALGEN